MAGNYSHEFEEHIKEVLETIKSLYKEDIRMEIENAIVDSFEDFELSSVTFYWKTPESIQDWKNTFSIKNTINVELNGVSNGLVHSIYTLYGPHNVYSLSENILLVDGEETEELSSYSNYTPADLDTNDFSIVVMEILTFENGNKKYEYDLHIYTPAGEREVDKNE